MKFEEKVCPIMGGCACLAAECATFAQCMACEIEALDALGLEASAEALRMAVVEAINPFMEESRQCPE